MKYIYKISVFVFSLMLITSCAIDDDAPLSPTGIVNSTASTITNFERIPASDTSYNVVVNLVSPINQLSRLYYTLDGVNAYIDVNSGIQRIEVPVDMSTEDVRVFRLVDIKSIDSATDNINTTISDTRNRTVIVKGDEVIIRMTWGNNTDIDLLLTAGGAPAAPYTLSAATSIDSSILVVPAEEVRLPGNAPNGDYTVSIIPFQAFNTPIEFSLEVYADDAYNFTGTVNEGMAASGGFFSPLVYETVVDFSTISKTGSSYTVVNNL